MEATSQQTLTIEALTDGRSISDARRASLSLAIEAGADDATLVVLRDAVRLSRRATIVLPAGRFEHLSRGRGWCRLGRGSSAVWAERADKGGYVAGPGRWTVGSTDGYARKDQTQWAVRHVAVGAQTWTIAV